jgi:hypothetical protein
VWSRIDQKTCLKSILAANLTPVVVPLLAQGDELVTDVAGIQAAVERVGPGNVAAVVTTTSCFAPRWVCLIGVPACMQSSWTYFQAQRCSTPFVCGWIRHMHERVPHGACCPGVCKLLAVTFGTTLCVSCKFLADTWGL